MSHHTAVYDELSYLDDRVFDELSQELRPNLSKCLALSAFRRPTLILPTGSISPSKRASSNLPLDLSILLVLYVMLACHGTAPVLFILRPAHSTAAAGSDGRSF